MAQAYQQLLSVMMRDLDARLGLKAAESVKGVHREDDSSSVSYNARPFVGLEYVPTLTPGQPPQSR